MDIGANLKQVVIDARGAPVGGRARTPTGGIFPSPSTIPAVLSRCARAERCAIVTALFGRACRAWPCSAIRRITHIEKSYPRRARMPKAYVLFIESIRDAAGMKAYGAKAMPTILKAAHV